MTWLEEVVMDLRLDNVEIMRARAEQAVGKVECDVVTARAVSALNTLAGLTIPLLGGEGEVLAIKGRSATDEVEKAAKVIRKLGGVETQVLTAGVGISRSPPRWCGSGFRLAAGARTALAACFGVVRRAAGCYGRMRRSDPLG